MHVSGGSPLGSLLEQGRIRGGGGGGGGGGGAPARGPTGRLIVAYIYMYR